MKNNKLSESVKKEIKDYIEILKKEIPLRKVILYGSYAKGKPKEYSDIDIAIISPSFYKLDIFERQLILSKAHHKFGEPIEPIGLTPEQVKRKKGFAREIVDTGIIVYSG